MNKVKKHVDKSKLCKENVELVKSLNDKGLGSGIANKIIDEPIPGLDVASSERWIPGKNNSFIVLGRDRPSHSLSGFGGMGATQCGRVDLIAGMGAAFLHRDGKRLPPCKEQLLGPNFAIDAARVYISQKTHLDKDMGLAAVDGDLGAGFSGIGLKADTLRIHGRHDVKIVTGRGKFQGLGLDGERLSSGGRNQEVGKICFIAGNDTGVEKKIRKNILNPFGRIREESKQKLQALVKGDNLLECIEDIYEALERLNSEIASNQRQIDILGRGLAKHWHVSPSGPTFPSHDAVITKTISAIKQAKEVTEKNLHQKDISLMRINYLKPIGSDYILSRGVYTT